MRRQLCGLGKSSSDSEIARSKVKERWPFPQSLTVDELARYRRRRVQGRPKDSLCRTEGSLGNIITEYRRAFRASSEDITKGLDPSPSFGTAALLGEEQRGAFRIEPGIIKVPIKSKGPACNLTVADAQEVMETRTESSRFIPHLNAAGRPPQLRRGTSLKREGKFSSDTEQSCYVAHEGNHRAELARRPTSLKMEGDMATTSENCDKFIEWLNVSRPELARLPTHLKLEGDFETSTENHEKYVPFVGARRPEILRQNANLRMEGESRYIPEYTEVFKGHNVRGRRTLKKPECHLRTEGNFYNTTETSEQFVNPRSMLEMSLDRDAQKLDTDDEDEDEDLQGNTETDNKIDRLIGTDINNPKGPPLEIPEYRDAFKDFPRERPKLIKPGDEIGRSDGSKISSSPTRSKFNTKIDMDPEYKSKFLDFSKESPVYRKPPLALRPSAVPSNSVDRMRRNLNGGSPPRGQRSSVNTGLNDQGNISRFDDGVRQRLFEATSEVRSQYVPYGNIPRVESIKMPANLQLEGNIDLQPEYRNAYCTKRNYHIPSGEPRMHRRRERSSSESRRRDNYWTHNNNGENFGRVNANEDQDAFQLLHTRVHEDSVVGKPPSGSRRASLIQRPTSHVDITDPSILRKRSPSPTYRLHVCNVDDEPRGFGRQKQSIESATTGSRLKNDSRTSQFDNNNVDINNYPRRSYSPSFGRADPAAKSFVVLQDHAKNKNGRESSTRYRAPPEYRGRNRPPGNINTENPSDQSTRDQFRSSNKTPNWMRPWYDNGTENVGTEAIVRVTHWLRGIWEMRRRGGPVQQWVDSIPSYGNLATTATGESKTEESTSQTQADVERKNSPTKDKPFIKDKQLLRITEDMTASAPITIPNSPAITMTCPASSVPHNRLARDPSFQSDSSHCSSVESLLEWRKADPEAILLGLGFGYPSSPQENGSMARIPRRFLQPSKLKGIAVDDFLKQQQESSESLDSASLGYRGLTGSPYVAPSEIVQKIMERLREHESHELDSFTNTNSSSDLFGSMQQDGRLSVLSPDNRQYLERPRSKSPDMRNKRMIIGEKSFAFGYNGDLIEIDSLNTEDQNYVDNLNDYQYNSNDPMRKLEPGISASTQSKKLEESRDTTAGKLSARRLAKQLSFDEDNSKYESRDTVYTINREEDLSLVDQRINEEQLDSLVTVVSRCSESNVTSTGKCESMFQDGIEDAKSILISRRASDGLCDLELKRNSLMPIEERRMSDGGIQTKAQRVSRQSSSGEKKKNTKPGLKRQARVSDEDKIDCEEILSGQKLSALEKIDDYVSNDKILREYDVESDGSRTLKTWDFDESMDQDDGEVASNLNEKIKEAEACNPGKKDECCKNDELNQICEHEKSSMDCSCHASSSNCRRKMFEIIREKQKLGDEVAQHRQEIAQLREMLNTVMSDKQDPGF